MSSSFRSFATILTEAGSPAAQRSDSRSDEPPTPPPIMPPAIDAPQADGTGSQVAAMLASFATEVTLMRARAAELVESEAESLLQMIAAEVLLRELELGPADLRALIERVRGEWEKDHRARFRIAEADRERLAGLDVALETDPAFGPGDLQIELGDGVLDLRLGTRLASAIAQHRIGL